MTIYLININNDCNQCMKCVEVCQTGNFKGLRRDSPFSKGDGWELKTTTDTFKVYVGDLVIIDEDKKIIDLFK